MTHNPSKKKRRLRKPSGKRTRRTNPSQQQGLGQFEQLEEKRCLAFLGFFDGITLDINQTVDDGDIVVENSTGIWRATDNSGTFTFVAARNINVNLLDNTGNQLDTLVDLEHLGDVTLNVGAGPRLVTLPGALNEIGGDLNINATGGTQIVDLSTGFYALGSFNADLGFGDDTIDMDGASVQADMNVSIRGVNEFIYSLTVLGDVDIDNSFEDVESIMTPNGGTTIEGSFSYLGGVNIDLVDLGGMSVLGDVSVDLGLGNPFFGNPQSINFTGSVEGDMILAADDSNLGNEITLEGSFLGNIVSYTGGDLVDTVVYSNTGEQADVFAILGGGDDSFQITTPINLLEIDFGNDLGDVFINDVVPTLFDFDITNFQQFDHFYTAIDDTLVMNQLADTGDITIDNDGGMSGFDWRMFSGIGGATSTVAAENLTLNMLSNTMNNVEVDLRNPVIASMSINLGDGDRNLQFTGIANNPLRDINITAGAGSQNVDLSVNQPLGVATLNVDLGTGFDTVDDNANSLIVDEDLILTGVNLFEHDGLLSVFRNAIIDTTGEVEDSLFAANGSLFVGSQFMYHGGDGADVVRLNGLSGAKITKEAVVNLGGSVGGLAQSLEVDDNDTVFSRSLMVTSTSTAGTDNFVSSAATTYLGNLSVNLGGGTNNADLIGVFNGTSVAYMGGDGVDTVAYGMSGTPAMLSVALGAGDDVFTLGAGVAIASPLTVDFGAGNDTFINLFGVFTFDANLLGLNGFNHIYTHAGGSMVSTQVEDFGDVVIDNGGPSSSLRVFSGGLSVLTPITSLNVEMLSGGTSNLAIDLQSALAGTLQVELGHGDRTFSMVGLDNSVGGSLLVTGETGAQTVNIAVNAPLSVTGAAIFDLGLGNDTVDESGNDVTVGGNLTLSGVNNFVNNAAMTVGGNAVVNVGSDDQATTFSDNSPLMIAGDFTYTGNDLDDTIILTAATSIGGNVDIDARNGNNTAVLPNVFGGTMVDYMGGTGTDDVTFGMTGNPAVLNIVTGDGDDSIELLAGASFATPLVLDFGNGNDTFVNGFGAFTFDALLKGLNGFEHSFDFSTGTLVSTQTEDQGPIAIDNNGTGSSFRFTTGLTSEIAPADNLILNLLSNTGADLSVALDNAHAGDLNLNLGSGARAVTLGGTSNAIGGNLTILASGAGAQHVDAALNAPLSVGGNAMVDLDSGFDSLSDSGNGLSVTGSLSMYGVNQFDHGGTSMTGGAFMFDVSGEAENNSVASTGAFSVGTDMTYLGGSGRDSVSHSGSIGGNLSVDLGDNTNGGTQVLDLIAAMSVGGTTNVTSTNASSPDMVATGAGTTLDGDVTIGLGNGSNMVSLLGTYNGADVKYNGGTGNDDFVYGLGGTPSNPNIKLNSGDDHFTLESTAAIDTNLRVDFAGGNDSFTNNYGAFDFNASLLDWFDFDRIYDFATDSLNITQLSATGNVTLDNNGAGGAIRLNESAITEMTPATNVRLFMMDNTTNDVSVDFDSAHAGDLILQLRSGARNVNFIGSNNSIGGLLRIEASEGIQNVTLASNADLNVGKSLVINGRNASDSVNSGANAVNVMDAMILRGINRFENTGTLNVAGDFTMVGVLENQFSQLINKGDFNVMGNVTYLGGGGVDEVKFNVGSASIGGFTYVNLGGSNSGVARQIVRLTGNFSADEVLITSGNSIGGNYLLTNASTSVAGDMIVNFANSTGASTGIFQGTYGGTYGTFRGGNTADTAIFGATAVNMEFATLLNGGNDAFTIDATASLMQLFVDFGSGSDNLANNLGDPLPFPATFINL